MARYTPEELIEHQFTYMKDHMKHLRAIVEAHKSAWEAWNAYTKLDPSKRPEGYVYNLKTLRNKVVIEQTKFKTRRKLFIRCLESLQEITRTYREAKLTSEQTNIAKAYGSELDTFDTWIEAHSV